jgi:hypothetical protein
MRVITPQKQDTSTPVDSPMEEEKPSTPLVIRTKAAVPFAKQATGVPVSESHQIEKLTAEDSKPLEAKPSEAVVTGKPSPMTVLTSALKSQDEPATTAGAPEQAGLAEELD